MTGPSGPSTLDRLARAGLAPALLGPAIAGGLVLLLALPVLDLDPPRSVTFSDSPFTDEGWYILNARNLVLFGRWTTDDWTLHLVTPVYAAIQAAMFAVLGVGILQARLTVVAATALTAILICAGLRRHVGPAPALVAAVAFATSTLVLYYGRLAYAELFVGLGLVAAALAATRAAGSGSFRWGLVAGTALAISAGAKPIALGAAAGLLLGTLVTGLLLGPTARPAVLRWAVGALGAAGLAALGWLVVVWLPAGEGAAAVLRILAPQLLPTTLVELVERIAAYPLRNDGAVIRSAPLIVGGLIGLAAVLRDRRSLPPRALLLSGAAAGWLVLGVVALLVLDYRPNRYVVPLLPALAILTAFAVRKGLELAPALPGRPVRGLVGLILVLAVSAQGILTQADWIARGTRSLPAIEARAKTLLTGAAAAVEGPYAPVTALAAPAIALVARPEAGINAGDLYRTRGVRWVVGDGTYEPAWSGERVEAWTARERVVCFRWGEAWQEVCLLRIP